MLKQTWDMADEQHADLSGAEHQEQYDQQLSSDRKGRSDAEFAFYFFAASSFVGGLWLWPSLGTHGWIALVPTIVLLGVGLFARWVHKS